MFLILVETVVLLQFLLFAIFAISRCFSSLMVIVNFFFLMLCFCSTCLIFPLSFAAPFSFLSSMLKYLLHIFYLHLGSFLFTGFFSFNTIFLATQFCKVFMRWFVPVNLLVGILPQHLFHFFHLFLF